MRVAMHKLKAGLSRYVAQARAGEVVEITSHDKPVARLVGVPAAMPPGLASLLARGAATWAGRKPTLLAPITLPAHSRSLSEFVIEDRG